MSENRSRLHLATPAVRPNMFGRVLLSGPAGAGKTFTALLIAEILAGADRTTNSIIGVDTEKNSMKTYADDFRLPDGSPGFMHVPFAAPYAPVDLAMTLREVRASNGISVVIIDSHSHFWHGQGGVLDVAGGKFTGWSEARPMQVDMVEAILECDAHVILCARSSMEHVQEKDHNGKIVVRKVGMKVKQDADLEYEVNVALTIDMSHVLHVSKSRTSAVPVGREYIAGHAREFAGEYREWLAAGEPACTKEQIEALAESFKRIGDFVTRKQAKDDFVDKFGRPEMLLISRHDEACEWIADRILGNVDTPNRAPDDEPKADEPKPETHEHGDVCPQCGGDQVVWVDDEPDEQGNVTQHDEPCPTCQSASAAVAGGTAKESTDEGGTDAERQQRIEAEVDALAQPDVVAALRALKRSPNGSVKAQRKRLVEARMKMVPQEAAAAS